MLDFNVGELAARLRRALGVRGRMPLGLDEHVVPVTLTADVSIPPWRTNPVQGSGGNYDAVAVSGRYAWVSLLFREPGAGGTPDYGDSCFLVTGLSVQPLSFITATPGTPAVANVAQGFFSPTPVLLGTQSQYLITTERQGVPLGAPMAAWELPVQLRYSNGVGATGLPTSGRFGYWRSGVVQPATWQETNILLRQGQALDFYASVASGTETSAVAVNVTGLFFGLGG